MKISILFIPLGIATLVLANGDSTTSVFEVPLVRNPTYRGDFQAQMQKMRNRYGSPETIAAAKKGVGLVPVTSPAFDTEYYGPVKIGTPGQTFNMNFDTGSADIWLASSTCSTTTCKSHRRFNSSSSTTFRLDPAKRRFRIEYGDGSYANGPIGTDMVNVGGIQIRTDDWVGDERDSYESVPGVKTFMTNAIAKKAVALPVVSAYLPSLRRSGGKGGHYLFGAIDSTKFHGNLTYVPVTVKGYWQVTVQDVLVSGQSLNSSYQGIVDTGTTLVILDDKTTAAVHSKIKGAYFDKQEQGWVVPCSLSKAQTGSVGFRLAGRVFEVPMADIAWEPVGKGKGKLGGEICYSGVQSIDSPVWILGDVFIKNNYCVFDQSAIPSVGIAPLQ